MITVEDIINKSREYLGVPFKHQGRTREKGLDCIGLLARCGEDLGIEVLDDLTYSTKVNPAQLKEGLERHCEKTLRLTYEPGYIGLMQFDKIYGPTHTVLITDKGMIHAYNKRGCVVEHRMNDVWRKKIVATYKINSVTYG